MYTIIADVTDFGAMQTAIEAGTPIAEYTVASYPWDVTVERTDADYLTVNLGTGAERTSTLTIVVTGEDDVKAKLADLCGELDSVFTEKTVAVELNDITYDPETDGVSVDAKGNVDITVDLTDKDYVAIVGIMLAYGNDDAELAGLVKSYLNNGVNKELVAAIEDASSADIISAVTAARNTSLQTMLDKFGIELTDTTIVDLADLYADALNIGAILIENLELTGGNRTLESFKEKGSFATYAVSKEGWHKMDINLTLILAEETAGYPDAVIGTPESKNAQIMQGFAVDEENGLIYIDVQCDGINWDIFKNAVDFNIENADATSITYETSTCDSGRVCTDDTITVTAYNPDQKLDPTVVTATYRIIVVGDTNKDGKTSVSDARLINRYEVDSEDAIAAMTDGPTRAADINKDNGISVSDTRKILRKYADYENYESSYK